MSILGCGYFARYTPRCNLKDPRNKYNIIHRPKEALDILSELIFVNGMPQEWNRYTSNPPFTIVTPRCDSRSDFSAYVTSHVHYTVPTYKIIAAHIERTTMLRADRAGEGVPR